MPAQKKPVLKALSDSHLRAIGMVAANWSRLEVTFLWVIARVVGIDFRNAVILAGAQNAMSWCDMLQKLTAPPEGEQQHIKRVKTPLDAIRKEVETLQKERNNIVHSFWLDPNAKMHGGLLGLGLEVRPKADRKASGTGIPKRGARVFLKASYDAKEMLGVATQIQKLEEDLLAWERQISLVKALRA